MNSLKRFRAILLSLLVLAGAVTAIAQQQAGAIEGTVTDQSGAVVAGAKVAITEKATGRVINLTTNGEGYFIARSLPPGTYSVKVEQSGFSSGLVEDVVVQTGQTSTASIGLKVGSATEVVQIEGTSAQLQVDTSRQTVDGIVTAEKIVSLPLNGRNFLDLAALQPSVQVRDGESIDPTKVGAYRAVSVNGSSGTGTRVQIDGIDVTDETVGTTVTGISTDAVQEFQLSRASFDLSTSLTTSGAVSISTRTGGNEFHGSGFYFWRNEGLGARLQFEPNSEPFHRHQYGYRFGGPIIKDRLFFFSNAEKTDQGSQSIVNFADFPQFSGNVGLPVRIRYTINRLDFNLTDRVKLFYSHRYSDDLNTGGGGSSPFQNVDWTIGHTVGADITGARLTHSFRFGYNNFNNRIESQELAPFNFLRTSQGIPFNLTVGDFNLGPNGLAPQQTYQDDFQSKYDGSYVRGNHTLRYGLDIKRTILGGFANFAGPLSITGLFTPETKAALPANLRNDPLAYPLDSFSTGPNTGFFTVESAHNLPHGGHRNTRYA
ncbi:MAG TPA: TonB-dependent receptor [Blastocatellia bacterium]|nr:TonB-dependent receptor [Blastocatellia bacterium]